jgi:hypothetical protein
VNFQDTSRRAANLEANGNEKALAPVYQRTVKQVRSSYDVPDLYRIIQKEVYTFKNLFYKYY